MSQVVVVVTFRVAPGGKQAAMDALSALAARAHDEAGCLTYALHEDPQDPSRLVIVERWTSHIALENHLMQPYVTGFASDALDGKPQIHVLRPVAAGDPMKGTL